MLWTKRISAYGISILTHMVFAAPLSLSVPTPPLYSHLWCSPHLSLVPMLPLYSCLQRSPHLCPSRCLCCLCTHAYGVCHTSVPLSPYAASVFMPWGVCDTSVPLGAYAVSVLMPTVFATPLSLSVPMLPLYSCLGVFTTPLSLSVPTLPLYSCLGFSPHLCPSRCLCCLCTHAYGVRHTSVPLGAYAASVLMPTVFATPLSLSVPMLPLYSCLRCSPMAPLFSCVRCSDLDLDLHKTITGSSCQFCSESAQCLAEHKEHKCKRNLSLYTI